MDFFFEPSVAGAEETARIPVYTEAALAFRSWVALKSFCRAVMITLTIWTGYGCWFSCPCGCIFYLMACRNYGTHLTPKLLMACLHADGLHVLKPCSTKRHLDLQLRDTVEFLSHTQTWCSSFWTNKDFLFSTPLRFHLFERLEAGWDDDTVFYIMITCVMIHFFVMI